MVTFSHQDAGTSESTWAAAGILDLPPLGDAMLPGPGGHLIVVAAHPDDESLGAAGLIHRALEDGASVHVIVCTAGEGSHPGSPTHTPGQLADIRRRELDTALGQLGATGPAGSLTWEHLGLPDGGVAEHAGLLDAALGAAIDGSRRTVLAAPYRFDAHTDHDAAGSAAARSAAAHRLGMLEFPIWYWHWAAPSDPAWRHWHSLPLGERARAAKRAVLAAHRSQTEPLSQAPGDEVLLDDGFLEHFRRPAETFHWTAPAPRDSTTAARVFDALYTRNPDPWQYLNSAYERRKREVTIASLPQPHYASAIEAGCSIGVLTTALAVRCSEVQGIDASQVALDAALQRTKDAGNVSLLRADLPREWPAYPPASVDLVVVSEIGYFLGHTELLELLGKIAAALRPGGDLLLCHWLHPIDGWELNGQQVHDLARSLQWERVVMHREEDFLLEVFRAPGGRDA